MQRTNFKYEIIIGEDCSTDNTRAICEEYADRYAKITLLPSERNLGMLPNSVRTLKASRGKYIAFCEGDDYWTDPCKLQVQADFLEAHRDYGLVYTDYIILHEKEGERKYRDGAKPLNPNGISSREQLFMAIMLRKIRICTLTVMYRRELLDMIPPDDRTFLMGDTPLYLDLANMTKFHYIGCVTGVYRKRIHSVSHPGGRKAKALFKLSGDEMRIYYCNKYNYPIPPEVQRLYNRKLIKYLFIDPSYEPIYPLTNPSIFQRIEFFIITSRLFFWLYRHKYRFDPEKKRC